jgi:acyl-coenzyme A thioesterase 13
MTEIPQGFAPLFRSSPFLDAIGPLYGKGEGPDLIVGLRIVEKHTNARGLAHGGIFATLADIALGYCLAFYTDPPQALVTTNLTLDFAGSARIGDWVEVKVDIQKSGSRLAFANAYIFVADQRIVRASAVFLVAGQRASGK